MMRSVCLLFLTAACAVVLVACGGSGPSCDAFCEKVLVCDTSDTLEECVAGCEQARSVFKSDVFSKMAACQDKPCRERDACSEAVLTSCTGDISSASLNKELAACLEDNTDIDM